MQVTQSHADAAGALVRSRGPLEPSPVNAPAFDAFLAAIERIHPDRENDPLCSWETFEGTGQAWAGVGQYVGLQLAVNGVEEITMSPDDAEARGWELIALAHLARQTPRDAPSEQTPSIAPLDGTDGR